ncbi:hypothetical protein DFH06DRAFT_1292481 [Mycena polygramma]|nr:hypothetical protein DFH06DRAFT_1292481 [Mycena polygramma]
MTHPCWNCGAPDEPALHCPPATEPGHGFARLRTGNDAPLDAEIPLIREIITNGEERLDRLKTQVRDLEAALAELAQSRDEAAEHLREHRAILHPLRRAPAELICEIFALAVDTPEDSGDDGGFGYDPPWYLGQICRSWRLWALAYPRLWSHITVPSSPASSLARAAFETLLLRSSNVPLNVCWTVLRDKSTVDDKSADLALAHCRRWDTLRLDLSIGAAAGALDWLLPIKGSIPSLRRLDMLCRGNIVRIPDVFSVAPSLCEVLLTDWELAYYSTEILVPWDQMTHYRGAFQEGFQLNILRTASKLMQCAISFETSNSDAVTPDQSHSIALYDLQRLCIEKPRFLHHLTAPSLKELYCMYAREDDIAAILPFVHRSRCLLQKLVLTSPYESSELATVLRGLPSLTYLVIQANESADQQTDLFSRMVIAGTSGDLCPNLISLVYGIDNSYRFSQEMFFTMLRSRTRSSCRGSRLTYLRIFDPFARSDICSAIRDLSGEGFDADVLTGADFALLTGKGLFP